MNRITQKVKQNIKRINCEARIEGAKAQWPTTVHGAYWWWNQNLDGLFSIYKNVFKSFTFRTKMSLCHLNSYVLVEFFSPNVHFLLHLAERRCIPGHSGSLGGSKKSKSS